MQTQFQYFAGRVKVDPIRQQMAMLLRGGVGGGSPTRAMQVAASLDQMIRQPGGGMAGQAVVLQAMGFGRPGGKTGYYEAMKQQQRGIQDPQNLMKVFQEVNRQRGVAGAGGMGPGQQEANLQLATMSGLSLEIVEQLQEIYNSDKSVEEKMTESEEVLKKALPVEKQSLKALESGFAGVKKHLNTIEAMNISIGKEIAPDMMKLQKLQLGLVKDLAKFMPQMIKILQQIFHVLRATLAWIMKDEVGDTLKAVDDAVEAQLDHVKKTKPESPMAAVAKAETIAKAEKALGEQKRYGKLALQLAGAATKPWTMRAGTKEQFELVKTYLQKPDVSPETKERTQKIRGIMTRATAAIKEAGGVQKIGSEATAGLVQAAGGTPQQQRAAINRAVKASKEESARRERIRRVEMAENQAALDRVIEYGAREAQRPSASDARKPTAGPKAITLKGTPRDPQAARR
jgi:hypothetical protein